MSKTTEIRTDGAFGAIYQELLQYNPKGPDVRDVVRTYAERQKKRLRDAWVDWFAWAASN